jgi:hypothetical protein
MSSGMSSEGVPSECKWTISPLMTSAALARSSAMLMAENWNKFSSSSAMFPY